MLTPRTKALRDCVLVRGQDTQHVVGVGSELAAAGVLRAMQIPALIMVQVIAATGLLILPAFSYDFGSGSMTRMRHKAMLVSILLVGATLSPQCRQKPKS